MARGFPPFRRLALASLPLAAVLALALASALAGGAAPARAQLMESAYPKDVPGFGTAPGVSVTSRIQQDVAWEQIPLGAELLHPEVTQSLSYDSAILANQRPSWISSTRPSLTLTSTDPARASALGAVLSADHEAYAQAPNQSYTDWTAAIGGTFDVADCKVTLGVAHLMLHQNDNTLDAQEYDTPVAFAVDTIRLSVKTPPARLTLEPIVTLTRFTFGATTIGGLPAPQSYRDRSVGEAGVTLSYGLMGYRDPNRLRVTLLSAGADYPNETVGQPPRDFIGGTAMVGIEHDLDGIWGWRFAVGVGGRAYSHGYQNQLVPLGEASVTWQPNERTTTHLVLLRRIEDATNEGVGGYVATLGGGAVDHEINRHLIWHLGANLERADYTDGAHQTILSGNTGLLWLISHSLRMQASVTLADHRSSTVNPYGEDAFLLGITAGL
ncbi:outer membrane beta-barrel protein [Acidisoma sp. C75]